MAGTPSLARECQPEQGQPSARSLRGLDGINFLMADVRDGVGPYLSVFLKGAEHWDSGAIGIAMAALSLGLVGRLLLDGRVSRNESFNHGGNFVAAGLAGVLGQYVGYHWTFYLVCAFALASAMVVSLINPAEIDHQRARGGEEPGNKCEPIAFRDLLKRRNLLIFLASVILFHFGNAAMLPMAGQVLALKHPSEDALALSACIIAAQLVTVGVAWAVGRASARGIGRKAIFLVALAVLPVRFALLMPETRTANPVASSVASRQVRLASA